MTDRKTKDTNMETLEKTKSAQDQIGQVLEFKWSVSRGRDTEGYNICTLRDQFGKRLAACKGGGYDMRGTVLGDWIANTFQTELLAMAHEDGNNFDSWFEEGARWERVPTDNPYRGGANFYGATWNHYKDGSERVTLDGACGIESMRKILRAIGLDIKWLHGTKKNDIYQVQRASV